MTSSPLSDHLRHWAEKGHASRPSAKLPIAAHLWEEFGLWTEGSGAGKKIHLPSLCPRDKGRKQEIRASGLTHGGGSRLVPGSPEGKSCAFLSNSTWLNFLHGTCERWSRGHTTGPMPWIATTPCAPRVVCCSMAKRPVATCSLHFASVDCCPLQRAAAPPRAALVSGHKAKYLGGASTNIPRVVDLPQAYAHCRPRVLAMRAVPRTISCCGKNFKSNQKSIVYSHNICRHGNLWLLGETPFDNCISTCTVSFKACMCFCCP